MGMVLGAIVGSFLATLTIRWPAGQSVLAGRSRCDGCQRTLPPISLIPIISHLWQRGRCRSCGAAIAPDHLAVEAGCAMVGVLACTVAPGAIGLAGALFGWLLVTLAVLDIRHFWLPDRLTLLLAGLGLAAVLVDPEPDLLTRLLGGGSGFLALWLVGEGFRRLRGKNGLGGGDPKLFGAIGCWLGWQLLPLVMLLAATTGLISALGHRLRAGDGDADRELPLGAFLAVAAFPLWLVQQSLGPEAASAIASAIGIG